MTKKLPMIPLDNAQSTYTNWFLAFSYMLAPEDSQMQSNIFHYRLLQHVLETPMRARQFFDKKKNENTVRLFRKALLNRTLRANIVARKKKAKRLGEIVRMLDAMKILGVEEPSINKAYFLSKKGFEKMEAKRGGGRKNQLAFSSKTYEKEKKYFNSVLHLCAAYSMIDPDSRKIKGPKTHKIWSFFANTKGFREFLLSFEYSRQADKTVNKGEYHSILNGPLYEFPAEFECKDSIINIDPSKFLAKVNRLIPEFTHDWE